MGKRTDGRGNYYAYGSKAYYNKSKCPYCRLTDDRKYYYAHCELKNGKFIPPPDATRCMGRTPGMSNPLGKYTGCPLYKEAKRNKASRGSKRNKSKSDINDRSLIATSNVGVGTKLFFMCILMLISWSCFNSSSSYSTPFGIGSILIAGLIFLSIFKKNKK